MLMLEEADEVMEALKLWTGLQDLDCHEQVCQDCDIHDCCHFHALVWPAKDVVNPSSDLKRSLPALQTSPICCNSPAVQITRPGSTLYHPDCWLSR